MLHYGPEARQDDPETSGKKHKLEIDLLLMDDESVGSEKTKAIVDELAKNYPIRYVSAALCVRYSTMTGLHAAANISTSRKSIYLTCPPAPNVATTPSEYIAGRRLKAKG